MAVQVWFMITGVISSTLTSLCSSCRSQKAVSQPTTPPPMTATYRDVYKRQMVGRPITLSIERPEPERHEKLLEIHRLTGLNGEGVEARRDASCSLGEGEILGVAGGAGSGQKELCETIAGLQKVKELSLIHI